MGDHDELAALIAHPKAKRSPQPDVCDACRRAAAGADAIQRAGYVRIDGGVALKRAADAAFDAIETAYRQRGDIPAYSYPDIELCVRAALAALTNPSPEEGS